MAAARYDLLDNLYLETGVDWTWQIEVDRADLDFTGATVRCSMKKNLQDATALVTPSVTYQTRAVGTIIFTLALAKTATAPLIGPEFWYDIKIDLTSGVTISPLWGKIGVRKTVT